MSDEPTALYRLYDSAGTLLYVGITNNPERRWKQHADTKDWWCDVHRRTVNWLGRRSVAEVAEALAIKTERPLYNWRHAGRAPYGVDLKKLAPARGGGGKYRVLTPPKPKKEAQEPREERRASHYDPIDGDPNGIRDEDGTMDVNPWADMIRRINQQGHPGR